MPLRNRGIYARDNQTVVRRRERPPTEGGYRTVGVCAAGTKCSWSGRSRCGQLVLETGAGVRKIEGRSSERKGEYRRPSLETVRCCRSCRCFWHGSFRTPKKAEPTSRASCKRHQWEGRRVADDGERTRDVLRKDRSRRSAPLRRTARKLRLGDDSDTHAAVMFMSDDHEKEAVRRTRARAGVPTQAAEGSGTGHRTGRLDHVREHHRAGVLLASLIPLNAGSEPPGSDVLDCDGRIRARGRSGKAGLSRIVNADGFRCTSYDGHSRLDAGAGLVTPQAAPASSTEAAGPAS